MRRFRPMFLFSSQTVVTLLIVFQSALGPVGMPISNELWRAAVERWVARIKRTPIIRRGVKRAPSDQEGAPSPSGQSHTGEKKCMVKKKGRKKHKDDSSGVSVVSTDEFYDGIVALSATLMCFGGNVSKECPERYHISSLKELLGCPGLGALLVVIMILILRSGDVETNPGPFETGRLLCSAYNFNLGC